MLDFRKQFQEIIEQSYIPFNIDKAATSDVWSNIYKLILPNNSSLNFPGPKRPWQ